MTGYGFFPYRNKLRSMARTAGRIAVDLLRFREQKIPRVNSNLVVIEPPPVTDDEGVGCCCTKTVYVGKDGAGDFGAIQDALDWISVNQTPSESEPWVVYVCPGVYEEDLTGLPWVSLVGIGTRRDAVRVTGVSGPTYTLSGRSTTQNMKFSLVVTGGNPGEPVIDALAAGVDHDMIHCELECAADTQVGRLIELGHADGMTLRLQDCRLLYSHSGYTMGANTHDVIDFAAGSFGMLTLTGCWAYCYVNDPDDGINFCRIRGTSRVEFLGNFFTIYNAYPLTAGSTRFITADGTGIQFCGWNRVYCGNDQGPAGSTYCYHNGPGRIDSVHNRFALVGDSFTMFYQSSNANGILYSHFDRIIGTNTASIWPTTYDYIHSDEGGTLRMTRDVYARRPYFLDPPACRAFLSANQNVPQGIPTQVLFDTADYDTGGIFGAVGSSVTVTANGYYVVETSLQFDMMIPQMFDLRVAYELLVNGATRDHKLYYYENVTNPAPLAHNDAIEPHDLLYLTAGDVITVRLTMISAMGSVLTVAGDPGGTWTHIEVHKVS